MENKCVFCGTSFRVPEHGELIANHEVLDLTDKLTDYDTNETGTHYRFHSPDELRTALENEVDNSSEEQWVKITDGTTDRTYSIAVNHLYYRLTSPEMADIIHEGAFESHLQPIVHMSDEIVFGYEALLRTHDRRFNPGQLFEFASKAGLHSMLDQKARKSAVEAKSVAVPTGQKIFINFLPSTIYVPEFCLKHTFHLIEKYNIDPADVIFEVVETEKVSDVDHLKNIFDTYKKSGMKVALDDVGSGYSTLEMLTLLKPDFVKIDRSYITDCHKNTVNQNFLFDVIARAKGLGITTLAEGIETEEEWNWLKEAGIDLGQGYYISKPQPYKELATSLPS
ncbi:EAL domain-containing protein [Thalassobacillus hwangdonensis]|uniref:EAL domain-containing protein n=1 Tax=Thalassobacillus hwangdonensis TaxID=546108 RepID=A0ABW3KZH8_9BACI